jgi:hypothetical protein
VEAGLVAQDRSRGLVMLAPGGVRLARWKFLLSTANSAGDAPVLSERFWKNWWGYRQSSKCLMTRR